MTFHGKNRSDAHTRKHLKESPLVVTLPLIALAIMSVVAGAAFYEPMLFGEFFKEAIFILPEHGAVEEIAQSQNGAQGLSLILSSMWHGMQAMPFWLAIGGIAFAWVCYIKMPELPGKIATRFAPITRALENKYWIDEFNQAVFANGAVKLGMRLWKSVDAGMIDGFFVNGSARLVGAVSSKLRQIQTGYVYQYAFAMIIGLVFLIAFAMWM